MEDEAFALGDLVELGDLGIMGMVVERLNENDPSMYKLYIIQTESPKIVLEIHKNYVVSGALLKLHTTARFPNDLQKTELNH